MKSFLLIIPAIDRTFSRYTQRKKKKRNETLPLLFHSCVGELPRCRIPFLESYSRAFSSHSCAIGRRNSSGHYIPIKRPAGCPNISGAYQPHKTMSSQAVLQSVEALHCAQPVRKRAHFRASRGQSEGGKAHFASVFSHVFCDPSLRSRTTRENVRYFALRPVDIPGHVSRSVYNGKRVRVPMASFRLHHQIISVWYLHIVLSSELHMYAKFRLNWITGSVLKSTCKVSPERTTKLTAKTSLESRSGVNRDEYGAAPECKGGGKRHTPDETCQLPVSSGATTACENLGGDPAGDRTRIVSVRTGRSSRLVTAAPCQGGRNSHTELCMLSTVYKDQARIFPDHPKVRWTSHLVKRCGELNTFLELVSFARRWGNYLDCLHKALGNIAAARLACMKVALQRKRKGLVGCLEGCWCGCIRGKWEPRRYPEDIRGKHGECVGVVESMFAMGYSPHVMPLYVAKNSKNPDTAAQSSVANTIRNLESCSKQRTSPTTSINTTCGPLRGRVIKSRGFGVSCDSWAIPERRGTTAAICECALASLCAVKSGTDLRDCGLDGRVDDGKGQESATTGKDEGYNADLKTHMAARGGARVSIECTSSFTLPLALSPRSCDSREDTLWREEREREESSPGSHEVEAGVVPLFVARRLCHVAGWLAGVRALRLVARDAVLAGTLCRQPPQTLAVNTSHHNTGWSEVSIECRRRNARAGGTGDPREYPAISGIVRLPNGKTPGVTPLGIEPGSPLVGEEGRNAMKPAYRTDYIVIHVYADRTKPSGHYISLSTCKHIFLRYRLAVGCKLFSTVQFRSLIVYTDIPKLMMRTKLDAVVFLPLV
ncbi:hypothetical protein PR048_022830 [Dryococelus australis]|uniref:Uncharacterized protein n=1 Tax=Dryococelus australis TaxID=614101 RepID=A0ABQ9GSD9_9NEOP|nr:hypothetical protein PR048_022830 [Dryococelus australis]